MSDKTPTPTGRIVRDMERQFPTMQLRCTECGRIGANDWGYLRQGWPKCHGYTMLLEAVSDE